MSSEETNPRIVVLQNNFKVCGKKKQEKRGKTRKNQEKPGKGEQKKGSFLARFGVEEKFLMMSGLVLLAWV
jgi:hypothetical protein